MDAHRNYILILGCCVAAFCLSFLTLEFRTDFSDCAFDYCDYNWSKGLLVPFRMAEMNAETNEIVSDDNLPLATPLSSVVQGIYARHGITTTAALIFGIFIPYALLVASGFLGLRRMSSKVRTIVARTLIATGVVLLILPIEFCIHIAYLIGWELLPRYVVTSPEILVLAVLGSTFLVGGSWVWFRMRRTPSII